MSKNYYNYSNPNQRVDELNNDPVVINTDATPEENTAEPVIGIVAGCSSLNIRAEASFDADVVCVVKAGSQLMVDVDKSTSEWLSVCTETGREGFCLSDYVNID